VVFCPENKATTALMQLEPDCYFQGKWNVEAYIDEFKDLIDLSGYMHLITIVLKFHRGLNPMTQDTLTTLGHSNLSHKPATDVARPATSVETATFGMMSTT
jgi:hypothetical protein